MYRLRPPHESTLFSMHQPESDRGTQLSAAVGDILRHVVSIWKYLDACGSMPPPVIGIARAPSHACLRQGSARVVITDRIRPVSTLQQARHATSLLYLLWETHATVTEVIAQNNPTLLHKGNQAGLSP